MLFIGEWLWDYMPRRDLCSYKKNVVYEIYDKDLKSRLNFMNLYLQVVYSEEIDCELVLLSDNVWSRLSGYFSALRKTDTWFTEKPMLTHKLPLHKFELGVWCATTAASFKGLIFL